jgi:hypothetical protein
MLSNYFGEKPDLWAQATLHLYDLLEGRHLSRPAPLGAGPLRPVKKVSWMSRVLNHDLRIL